MQFAKHARHSRSPSLPSPRFVLRLSFSLLSSSLLLLLLLLLLSLSLLLLPLLLLLLLIDTRRKTLRISKSRNFLRAAARLRSLFMRANFNRVVVVVVVV